MSNGSMRHRVLLAPAMGCSLATLLSIGLTFVQAETATALDVGASVGAAGVGAGLNAGLGSDGLSAGVSVGSEGSRAAASGNTGPSGIGGAMGANAGAVGASAQGNLGTGGLSAGAGVSSGGNGASVSGNVGPSGLSGGPGGDARSAGATASAGIGGQQGSSGAVGTGLGGTGTSASGSGLSGAGSLGTSASASANGGTPGQGAPGQGHTAGPIASIAPTALATSSSAGITLPGSLWPHESGASDGGWFRGIHVLKPLRARPGTPLAVVQSCRNALVSGASSYGAIQVDVASAGRTARLKDGNLSAPVEARIVFQRGNRVQVRQARVTCRVDEKGRTVAMF
jgi:hypothetical protein